MAAEFAHQGQVISKYIAGVQTTGVILSEAYDRDDVVGSL